MRTASAFAKAGIGISIAQAASTALSAEAKSLLDWIANNPRTLGTNVGFSLENQTIKQLLSQGSRTFGIGLVWVNLKSSQSRSQFQFVPQSPGNVTFGSPFAIYVTGGGYLRYEKRTFGINLGWSPTPVYEWYAFSAFQQLNKPIQGGFLMGLFNAKAKDILIYGERTTGVNLVWARTTGTANFAKLCRDFLYQAEQKSPEMAAWFRSKTGA